MGLTKQYLRYRAGGTFNIIGSGRGSAVYVGGKGDMVAVAAVQSVVIWDMRKKEKVQVMLGEKHEVTVITTNR